MTYKFYGGSKDGAVEELPKLSIGFEWYVPIYTFAFPDFDDGADSFSSKMFIEIYEHQTPGQLSFKYCRKSFLKIFLDLTR